MMFSANQLIVHDGSYTVHLHDYGNQEAGLDILAQRISVGAMHDSAEREPPPRCHPETRKHIVRDFLRWIKDPSPQFKVAWLHAPFGHGKTAAMQTVVDILVEEMRSANQDNTQPAYFAGAFFFGRNKKGRDKAHHLLPTIAYQMATYIPAMREHINKAVMADRSLPLKSMEIQLLSLIIRPLQQCTSGSHHSHSPTVIIDGLDECDTAASQRTILQIIAKAINDHQVPLRFLIASRPEAWIRDMFERPSHLLSDIHWPVFLDGHEEAVGIEEMRVYLKDGFEKIFHEHPFFSTSTVECPWPEPKVIDVLIERACKQWIIASTILLFVENEMMNPLKQLDIIMKELPGYSSAFSSIDLIYQQILATIPTPNRKIIHEVLLLVVGTSSLRQLSALAEITSTTSVDIQLALRSLYAVVDVDDIDLEIMEKFDPDAKRYPKTFLDVFWPKEIELRHLSFEEFLTDQARSKEYYMDPMVGERLFVSMVERMLNLTLRGAFTPQTSIIQGLWHNLAVIAEEDGKDAVFQKLCPRLAQWVDGFCNGQISLETLPPLQHRSPFHCMVNIWGFFVDDRTRSHHTRFRTHISEAYQQSLRDQPTLSLILRRAVSWVRPRDLADEAGLSLEKLCELVAEYNWMFVIFTGGEVTLKVFESLVAFEGNDTSRDGDSSPVQVDQSVEGYMGSPDSFTTAPESELQDLHEEISLD